jgi:hypothetical protein
MLSKTESSSTMAACTIPLMVSPRSRQACTKPATAVSEDTSQGYALALHPRIFSELSNVFASSVFAPDREMKEMLRAPAANIVSAIDRPIPPRPPARTYVASGSRARDGSGGGTARMVLLGSMPTATPPGYLNASGRGDRPLKADKSSFLFGGKVWKTPC